MSPTPRPSLVWQIARPLAVPALLVALAAFTLAEPIFWWLQGEEKYDQDAVREWVQEATVFQTLPELVASLVKLKADYEALQLQDLDAVADPAMRERLREERKDMPRKIKSRQEEIFAHLKALGDPPTKIYPGRLILFPVIYRMTVRFDEACDLEPVVWDSGRPQHENQFRTLSGVPLVRDPGTGRVRAAIDLRYKLRVYATQQHKELEDRQRRFRLGALALVFAAVASIWFYVAQRQQREREQHRVLARQQVIEAEQMRLQEEVKRQEAELQRQEAQRKQKEAERTALELKSQLFANIGIMAGSYAHNIKNLLVRPNDLIGRCLEEPGVSGEQQQMLGEVRQTLGTVTERLQQILQTVRRDPNQSESVRIDLNRLCADLLVSWEFLGNERWKLTMRLEAAPEPLWIQGDASHLQQALENLLFNARDATFEMRKWFRDQARTADPAARKQALIAAASWRGAVTVRTRREGDQAVLEVTDNGVGMTEEVRRRCTETHFSTKRDNALFEGMTAGMGLGLSFVQVILDHHRATLEIESQPHQGATFRVRFPLAAEAAP